MLESHVLKTEKYEAYKQRANFYNAMGRTVEGLSGYIFLKEPFYEVPDEVESHMKDITMTKKSFAQFALKGSQEILITGRTGILIDMAIDPTLAERPYWIAFRAEDITSWRSERRGGEEVLTRVVLHETAEEPDEKDEFVTNEIEQYRVLSLDEEDIYTQVIYRKKSKSTDEWIPWAPEGENPKKVPLRRGAPLNFIPFVIINPISLGVGVEKPPLLDLVNVNLSHYRLSADLMHGLHYTALPTPWIAGMRGSGPNSGELSIGSGTAWELEKEGRAGMLEFTGAGLGAIREEMERIEKMMATLGARLLETQPTQAETATAVSMRHAGEHATLQTITDTLEQGLTLALKYHYWWIGTTATVDEIDDVTLELNRDFFSKRMDPAELTALLAALQSETISYETFHYNLQQGEIMRPDITVEEEKKAIADWGLGMTRNVEGQ
jgi:hypothetical protein